MNINWTHMLKENQGAQINESNVFYPRIVKSIDNSLGNAVATNFVIKFHLRLPLFTMLILIFYREGFITCQSA